MMDDNTSSSYDSIQNDEQEINGIIVALGKSLITIQRLLRERGTLFLDWHGV
jgi:hypothetical protein